MRCPLTKTATELHAQYECIFKDGNRNSASHLWATHLFHHARELTVDEFQNQFGAFCPVSGSPIGQNGTAISHVLPTTDGKTRVEGEMKYCCWPCACDVHDASRADNLQVYEKDVALKDGTKTLTFVVIDDPCQKGYTIPSDAPAVKCVNGRLSDATFTASGDKVIVGMMTSGRPSSEDVAILKDGVHKKCEMRKQDGFKSGMGGIFRELTNL